MKGLPCRKTEGKQTRTRKAEADAAMIGQEGHHSRSKRGVCEKSVRSAWVRGARPSYPTRNQGTKLSNTLCFRRISLVGTHDSAIQFRYVMNANWEQGSYNQTNEVEYGTMANYTAVWLLWTGL